jgi:long-chain acyl-CoA synthetase
LVEQVWVYGNSFESALVAVVVPAESAFRSSLAAAGIEGAASASSDGSSSDAAAAAAKKLSLAELCKKPEAVKHVLAAMTATGKDAKLKGFEFVKTIHLDDHHFSVEDDTLTPTFKLKRPQLQKRYQSKVDELYAKLKQGA